MALVWLPLGMFLLFVKKKVLIISNKLLNSLLQFSLSAYSDFKKIKYSIYL